MAQLQTNTHDVLLRNAELLTGKVALLGVSEPALLAHCPQPGLAMSEHAGVYEQLCQHANWQACFGYQCNEQDAGGFDTLVIFLPKARAELEYAWPWPVIWAAKAPVWCWWAKRKKVSPEPSNSSPPWWPTH